MNTNNQEIMTGGPVDGEVRVPDAPKKDEGFVYEGLGGKKITDPKELATYAKEIEARAIQAEIERERASKTQPTMNAPVVEEKTDEDNIEDLLFQDPKKAIKLIEERAETRVKKMLDAKDATQKFWDDFYTENPDLKSHDRVVQLITREKWNEVANIPLAEAKKRLVDESRKMINSIRGEEGTKTVVNRTSASTLGSSGEQLPRVSVPQEVAGNFCDEIKKFQRRA